MITDEILLKAYRLMRAAVEMAATYEKNRAVCRYVHSTSRGHEAVQLATAFQLLPCDWISPYYRDESILLGLGFEPYDLMLQLLAKDGDIFTGGREYYSHPNYRGSNHPRIIHQSSATGMQAIPATGLAQGLAFLERIGSPLLMRGPGGVLPIVVCSLGDASVTEGEVSEAFQFAVLKKLPIIFLVQDNNWGISVRADESRAMDSYEYAAGFKGMGRLRIDGSDFQGSYETMGAVIREVRGGGGPFLVQAYVPLLGHHTSGVRREFYRDAADLAEHAARDPVPRLKAQLLFRGVAEEQLATIEDEVAQSIAAQFSRAVAAPEPVAATVGEDVFAATPVLEERGERTPAGREKVPMVDAALFAIRELME
ncbi:MAG TPA: thiamine pyrophosphate-dependent dehydrogenase E1 component subunit alpha, partial [Puia sp.]|nr:thiamine pyrophosphate-dependent dehydrogenase E1 component subunit alpha [Puia sp.]